MAGAFPACVPVYSGRRFGSKRACNDAAQRHYRVLLCRRYRNILRLAKPDHKAVFAVESSFSQTSRCHHCQQSHTERTWCQSAEIVPRFNPACPQCD